MSLKYVDETALNENVVKTKEYVEDVRVTLDTAKQNSTLSTPIEGKTTVETALQALSDKTVSTDDTTIVKDASTGELSAVTATDNTKGIVQPDGTTITIDENGVISGTPSNTFNSADFDVENGEVSLTTEQRIFTGTKAQWNALSTTEKSAYTIVNITDDTASGEAIVVDEVTDGNLNPVTSNAVASATKKYIVTGTLSTDDFGNLRINRLLPTGKDVVVLKVKPTSSGSNFSMQPCVDYTNTWYAIARQWTDDSKVANTSIAVEVTYIYK